MIYINRSRNDENGTPIRPSENWFKNAEAATNKAIEENGQHNADQNIYGHHQVRAALEKLFYDKCSYCETSLTRMDWNVEHFRPKGRVAERQDDHPGYYWLTYEWTNLYPSCIFCNQRRKDKPRWGDLKYADAGGKMDQFPLEDEDTRAMSHNVDVHHESILLIDPCDDDPERYLSYDPIGNIIALDSALKKKSRGRATINVFNLWPRRLRDSRRKIIDFTVDLLKGIRKLEFEGKNSAVTLFKDLLQNHLLHDRCTHAGVARAVANDPGAFGVTV